MNKFQIAIDGPAGAGKSTIAKILSKKLNILHLDTGALYRSIAYFSMNNGGDVNTCIENMKILVKFENNSQQVYINDENVTPFLRSEEVSMGASNVSKIPKVREFLLDLQRDIAISQSVVMDGRDIGTVILPNATVKIFLKASPEVRAGRRFEESTEETSLENVLADLKQRDLQDTTRQIAPLVPASDAIVVDTSNSTVEQSVEQILEIIYKKVECLCEVF